MTQIPRRIIATGIVIALIAWIGPTIYDRLNLTWDKAQAHSIVIDTHLGWGLVTRDLELINNDKAGDLLNVRVTVSVYPNRNNGSNFLPSPTHRQVLNWDAWRKGETKTVSVPAGGFQSIAIEGEATATGGSVAIIKVMDFDRTIHGGMTVN